VAVPQFQIKSEQSTVKEERQMALSAHEQLITDEKLIAEANEFADDVVKIRDDPFERPASTR
jgi:hypothetical protein